MRISGIVAAKNRKLVSNVPETVTRPTIAFRRYPVEGTGRRSAAIMRHLLTLFSEAAAMPGSAIARKPWGAVRQGVSASAFSDDFKKFDVPTPIIHGEDDQIVPVGESSRLSTQLKRNTTLKARPGLPKTTGTSSTAPPPPPS